MIYLAILSRLFDPLVVFGYLTIIAAVQSGMGGNALFFFLLIMFLGMVCLPLSFLGWAIQTKRVANWDVSDRQQRVKVLTAFIPFLLLDFLLVRLFGNIFLLRVFVAFAFWYIGFFGITLFFKLSGHVAGVALGGALLIRWFGLTWWPILLVIPFMGWVRLALNKHTLAQTIVGAAYSLGMVFLLIVVGMV